MRNHVREEEPVVPGAVAEDGSSADFSQPILTLGEHIPTLVGCDTAVIGRRGKTVLARCIARHFLAAHRRVVIVSDIVHLDYDEVNRVPVRNWDHFAQTETRTLTRQQQTTDHHTIAAALHQRQNHYRPLLLQLTETNPLFQENILPGSLSDYLRDYVDDGLIIFDLERTHARFPQRTPDMPHSTLITAHRSETFHEPQFKRHQPHNWILLTIPPYIPAFDPLDQYAHILQAFDRMSVRGDRRSMGELISILSNLALIITNNQAHPFDFPNDASFIEGFWSEHDYFTNSSDTPSNIRPAREVQDALTPLSSSATRPHQAAQRYRRIVDP